MLTLKTKKLIREHKWNTHSNESQFFKRIEEQSKGAIKDLILLAENLEEEQLGEIFTPRTLTPFLRAILNPKEILNEIEAGISNDGKKKVKKLIDRKEAIKLAIKSAKKGDSVIITGKGSEAYMRIANGKKLSWNEKEITLKILNNEKIEI